MNNENTIRDQIKLENNPYGKSGFIDDEWPMYNYDLNNSGFSPSLAPNTCSILWEKPIGYSRSSPAVVDGKVYIGSEDIIKCLDANNGNTIWVYQTSDDVHSSPVVLDGRVYIGSWDDLMYCLDAETGERIWIYPTGSVTSSPAVYDGKVYFASNYLNGCWVYCLETDMGNLVWRFKTGDYTVSSPAVSDGRVYIVSNDEYLYCLDADNGSMMWKFNTNDWFYTSSPVIYKDFVLIGHDTVFCLNKNTGKEIWNSTGHPRFACNTPAVAYDKIYISEYYGKIFCLDVNDGHKIWEFKTGSNGEGGPPIVADAKVFVGSADYNIYCFDALNGSIIWNYKIDGEVDSSPAVAYGNVYVHSEDTFYCFGGNQPPLVEIINPKEDYFHLFGNPLLKNPLNLIGDTVSICGFKFKPVIIKVSDDQDNNEDLIIKIYLNGKEQKNVSYCPDSGLYKWFWTGPSFGKYYLQIIAEDSHGRIGINGIKIWNYCFFP